MEFHLKIVTPDGLLFDGNARKIILRTTEGDIGILARHSDIVTPLSIGVARVFTSDGERIAACSGGLLSVSDGEVSVIASTFEWSDNIDVERALRAKERAEERINKKESDYEMKLAEIKLKRSIARINASRLR